METVAGCRLSWLAFQGRLQIRVSRELQFPEDILSSPKPGTEAHWLCRIFQKASSSLHSDDRGGDEASWIKLLSVGRLGRRGPCTGQGRSCRCRSVSVSAQPLLVQSSVQSRGRASLRSLSEGTASAYMELQIPKQKHGV